MVVLDRAFTSTYILYGTPEGRPISVDFLCLSAAGGQMPFLQWLNGLLHRYCAVNTWVDEDDSRQLEPKSWSSGATRGQPKAELERLTKVGTCQSGLLHAV